MQAYHTTSKARDARFDWTRMRPSTGNDRRRLVNHSNAVLKGNIALRSQKVRCRMFRTQDSETTCAAESSTRNFSAQVTMGLKIS